MFTVVYDSFNCTKFFFRKRANRNGYADDEPNIEKRIVSLYLTHHAPCLTKAVAKCSQQRGSYYIFSHPLDHGPRCGIHRDVLPHTEEVVAEGLVGDGIGAVFIISVKQALELSLVICQGEKERITCSKT